MCSRTEDVDIIPNIVNAPEQSDHQWMIANSLNNYNLRLDNLFTLIQGLDSVTSIIEFNCGKFGMFSRLVTLPNVNDYRLIDRHFQCTEDAKVENEVFRATRPEFSFDTKVCRMWEYEAVTQPIYRYKSDVAIVHYLSTTPDDKVTEAIGQICRVSSNNTFIIDYPPNKFGGPTSGCKVDIEKVFKDESPDYEIRQTRYNLSGMSGQTQETIYHIIHPLP
jgi:hypothetical protein